MEEGVGKLKKIPKFWELMVCCCDLWAFLSVGVKNVVKGNSFPLEIGKASAFGKKNLITFDMRGHLSFNFSWIIVTLFILTLNIYFMQVKYA